MHIYNINGGVGVGWVLHPVLHMNTVHFHVSDKIQNKEPHAYQTKDGFTNFMHTILTKVVPDNLKACLRFVKHSNN